MTGTRKLQSFLFLACVFIAIGAQASTINANSCSATDVQAAINQTSTGDTVNVPGGSCTWNTVVTLSSSQQITLNGGGATITWGSSGGLSVTPGTSTNTYVTNFTFNGSFTNGDCPIGFYTSTSPLTQTFRFYNNTLNGGNPSSPGTLFVSTEMVRDCLITTASAPAMGPTRCFTFSALARAMATAGWTSCRPAVRT